MIKPTRTQFYFLILLCVWLCSVVFNWIFSPSSSGKLSNDVRDHLQGFFNQMEKRQDEQMTAFFDKMSKRLDLLVPNLEKEWKEKQMHEWEKFVTERLAKFEDSHRDQDRKLLNSLLEYQPKVTPPASSSSKTQTSVALTPGPNDRPFGMAAPSALDEVCWSKEYRHVFIPEFANDESPAWTSMAEAKAFCEFYHADCSGITRVTLLNGAYSYEARGLFLFRPSAANESSWIKYKCNGTETDPNVISALKTSTITGVVNTSVPKGFYESPFNCSRSGARSAMTDASGIKQIWVWGERNSGTGITQALLDQNFALSKKVIGGLPWKHGWMHQQDLTQMHQTLNILLVKDVYAWLASMQKSPIHAPDHADLPLEVFMLREWYAEKDIGEIDKHPVKGTRLANIFQVRAAKLIDWNAVSTCLPYTHVLRYEDLIANTTAALLTIAEKFNYAGLALKRPGFVNTSVCVISFGGCSNKKEKNQTKILAESEAKKQYYLKHQYLDRFEKNGAELVTRNLDSSLEAQFGYNYSYVKQFILDRENARAQAGLTPERIQGEKRKLPRPKRKPRKNRKKWKGL